MCVWKKGGSPSQSFLRDVPFCVFFKYAIEWFGCGVVVTAKVLIGFAQGQANSAVQWASITTLCLRCSLGCSQSCPPSIANFLEPADNLPANARTLPLFQPLAPVALG